MATVANPAFLVVGSRTWNDMPDDVTSAESASAVADSKGEEAKRAAAPPIQCTPMHLETSENFAHKCIIPRNFLTNFWGEVQPLHRPYFLPFRPLFIPNFRIRHYPSAIQNLPLQFTFFLIIPCTDLSLLDLG